MNVTEQSLGGYKLLIDMDPPDSFPFRSVDVHIINLDQSVAARFRKDQQIYFSGNIQSIDNMAISDVNIFDVILENAQFYPNAQLSEPEPPAVVQPQNEVAPEPPAEVPIQNVQPPAVVIPSEAVAEQPTTVSHAASFDCSKAHTFVEETICSDSELSELDYRMAEEYQMARGQTSDDFFATIKKAQKAWLKVRNKCQDLACLKRTYEKRIIAIRNSYSWQ